ncbi:MAG: murein biosynthesis integral membrane protein MurJ [Psychrobacter sp.]|uniref:murein biosynthesis integral membrane protein MurJ n=1 Tax=unclassified Psychrobacter TaxID=196806 RepID=UPI00178889E2|nr:MULTISPECIES: murein biosynthesis integral membrane protein MurJ [unclassified Psychrobacter]MBE0442068.1 murein biosynthesis integral membrane protein MurJ [Psychrobacter sp. FME13]
MAKSRLFRSTMVVSSMTMLSRILGLVRDIVLLGAFGAGGLMDAFLVAFKIPNFLRRLFAEGAFSQAFVPVLSEYKEKYSLQQVQILVSRTSGALLMALSMLTVVVILIAPWVVTLFAPGFADQPDKFAITTELLRLTFPYLLFISMTAFASGILQSYGRFAAPAFAPVLLNLCMIGGALIFAPMFDTPIMALGYAVAIAGLLQFLIQLPQLWQQKLLVAPKIDFQHEGVRRILKLMLPAIFGVSVTQINLLLNTVFASLMIGGSVSWLYAAERMSELPLGLIGVAIGTVILPSLSKSEAQKDDVSFKKTLDWAARLIILVGLPAAAALFMLADVLMQSLFMRGEFTLQDSQMSALALRSMAGGILGFMLIKIFAPAFFARQDTKTPVKIGIISVFANMIFSIIFISIFYFLEIPLHGGLALATTGAAFVNAGLLYYFLHKRDIFRFGSHWKKLFAQFVMSTSAMVGMLYVMLPYFPTNDAQWKRIVALLIMCAVGALVYGVVLLATGFRPRQLKHG